MTALHQFGAEMLKLSRGLESFAPLSEPSNINADITKSSNVMDEEPCISNIEQTSNDHRVSSKAKLYVQNNFL